MTLLALHRRAAAGATALLTAGAVLITLPAAQAAPDNSAAVSPSTGSDAGSINLTTPAACSAPSTNVLVKVTGKGFPAEGKNVVGNSPIATYSPAPSGGITVPLTMTMRDYANEAGFKTLEGRYDLTVVCRKAFGSETFGDFTGSVWFTSNTAYQSTAPVAATSTTLTAAPATSAIQGANVTLTASVTPADAPGTVTFLDGTTPLGSPVPVVAGHATFSTSALAVAAHTLTASFTPADPAAHAPSVSAALGYTVKVGPPVLVTAPRVTGTVRVASTVTCAVSYSGATSIGYQWLRDGAVVTGTARTRLLGPSDYGHKTACRTTGSNGTGTITATSAAVTVGIGPALRNTVRPSIAGTARAGYRLTARAGTWNPTATGYTFVWKRDGRTIRGAVRSTYIETRADRGHLISVTITANRPAYTNGVATSGAVRVR